MRTCNGCEYLISNMPTQLPIGQIVYVATCDYFYANQSKGMRIIKQYWGDFIILTPKWCPKEVSHVY